VCKKDMKNIIKEIKKYRKEKEKKKEEEEEIRR